MHRGDDAPQILKVRDLSGLQPWLVPYVTYAQDWHQWATGGEFDPKGRLIGGTRPTVTSTYRSFVEQEREYANRLVNPYPVAQPGRSAHQYGLAFDSDVPDEQMAWWLEIRRRVGFNAQPSDEVHAEVPGWREIVARAGIQLPALF